MKFCFVFLLLAALPSCKSVVKTVYGVNKNIEFKSRSEYEAYVTENAHIDLSRLYYLDRNSYDPFVSLIIDKKVNYFFGHFVNDSTEIRKSEYLLDNESCVGRVLREINMKADSLGFIRNETFKNNTFLNIATKEPFAFDNNGKRKIVLIYSYKAGSINRNEFDQIQSLISSSKDYELVVITIDDLYRLN